MDKKKIVIVEDDRFLRRVYEEKFKKISDYDIFVAADGAAAIAVVKKEVPDLVLLDLVLPEMDGFTVLEHIKKDPATADVPVIILSNLGQEDDIVRGKELGAIDYLIKSDISIQAIEDKVRSILQLQSKKKTAPVSQAETKEIPASSKPVQPLEPVKTPQVSAPVAPEKIAVPPVSASSVPPTAVFCPSCGAKLNPGNKFCSQCGAKIS